MDIMKSLAFISQFAHSSMQLIIGTCHVIIHAPVVSPEVVRTSEKRSI